MSGRLEVVGGTWGVQTPPPPDHGGIQLYDHSQDGLALDMGRQWRLDARYVAKWNRWLFWSGNRWQPDEKKACFTRTRNYLRSKANKLVLDARRTADDKWIEAAERQAKALRCAKMVADVSTLAQSNAELAATVDQWDAEPWLLTTPDGVIDLRNGELRPARPEDYLTKTTAVGPAPPGTAAPLWTAFVDRITGQDKELQGFLQRFAGYSLTGSIREHSFCFGWGTGANGKSTFLETLAGILGEHARTIPVEVLMVSNNDRHPTEIARLCGVRFVIASETEEGRKWAEARIKALTGGDKIAARFMRQDFFEFYPQFKLFVIGNKKPSLRSVDESIRRRMHFVPFTVTIPRNERDEELPNKLRAEWPAILRWMIDGCVEWHQSKLSPPKSVVDATDGYFAGEDSFQLWFAESGTKDPNAEEGSSDLWKSWQQWARNAGEDPGYRKGFSDKLIDAGLESKKDRYGNRCYRGYRLHPAPEFSAVGEESAVWEEDKPSEGEWTTVLTIGG